MPAMRDAALQQDRAARTLVDSTEGENSMKLRHHLRRLIVRTGDTVSYTHLTLPTTPYV